MKTKPNLRGIRRVYIQIQAKQSLEIFSVDIIGHFPRSNGFEYILSIVGVAYKLLMIYALWKATTTKILKERQEYNRYNGYPHTILIDNGFHFTSKQYKSFVEEKKFQHILISRYHPQSNLVERYTREIGRLLSLFCNQDHTSRSRYVSEIVQFFEQHY